MANQISKLTDCLYAKSGDLTTQDLAMLRQQVQMLPGGGVWSPFDNGGMYWGVVANNTQLLLIAKPPSAFSNIGDRQQMSNAAGFAGYAPAYVIRLIEEIEKLQQRLANTGSQP